MSLLTRAVLASFEVNESWGADLGSIGRETYFIYSWRSAQGVVLGKVKILIENNLGHILNKILKFYVVC